MELILQCNGANWLSVLFGFCTPPFRSSLSRKMIYMKIQFVTYFYACSKIQCGLLLIQGQRIKHEQTNFFHFFAGLNSIKSRPISNPYSSQQFYQPIKSNRIKLNQTKATKNGFCIKKCVLKNDYICKENQMVYVYLSVVFFISIKHMLMFSFSLSLSPHSIFDKSTQIPFLSVGIQRGNSLA